MKKIFTVIALILVCATINSTEITKFEYPYVDIKLTNLYMEPALSLNFIRFDKKTGEHYLVISSDNQFEDKKVYIKLGKMKSEVIETLNSLIDVNNKMDYTVDNVIVAKGGQIIGSYKYEYFEYWAGTYKIETFYLKKLVKKINK